MSRKEDIVTYALYQLGGAKGAVHIEEIANKCYELAKSQFSWQLKKYQHYPDIKAVYYALDGVSRGCENKLVRKIADRSKGGQRYQLTQVGAQWIKKNKDHLAAELSVPHSENAQYEVQQSLRELKKRDPAFKRYKHNGEKIDLSIYEFIDFLGCSLETSPTAVRKKFADMETKAELVDDVEIKSFLAVAKTKFSHLFLVQ